MSSKKCSCDIKGIIERLEREICFLLRKKKPEKCRYERCDCERHKSCGEKCDVRNCSCRYDK